MQYVILVGVWVFSLGLIYYARQKLLFRLEVPAQRFKEKGALLEKRLEEKEALREKNSHLEEKASTVVALYDLTKDITSTLNKDELFSIFRHQTQEFVKKGECLFLEKDQDLTPYASHHLYPVTLKKDVLGYLVTKDIEIQDREALFIMMNQLALGLKRVDLYRRIEASAITDSLTGVFTRRYYWERFSEEFERAQRHSLCLSCLMIDLDHFKPCNDRYGHLAGDTVLKEVARVIKSNLREIDLLGRVGGEEFAVLLPDTDKTGAQQAANRIREAVAGETIVAYDEHIKITLSIGVAGFPQDASGLQELFDKSDWALYRAKHTGRNRVCVFGLHC